MIKSGMKCRIRDENSAYNMQTGEVFRVYEDKKTIDVFFYQESDIVEFPYSSVFFPLHDGVFLENEKSADWFNEYAAARIKLHGALVVGAIQKFEDLTKFNLPDEIVNSLKKIVDVLGTKEGIALITFLFSHI